MSRFGAFRLIFAQAAKRGLGTLIYVPVAIWTIPADVFVRDLFMVMAIEFVYGMMLPTLRTSGLSSKITSAESSSIACMVALGGIVFALLFAGGVASTAVVLLMMGAFPIVLSKVTSLDRVDINRSLKFDGTSALLGAGASAMLLAALHFAGLSAHLASPLFRIGTNFGFILYFCRDVPVGFNVFAVANARIAVRSIPKIASVGLDYLIAVTFARTSLLWSFSLYPMGDQVVKFALLVYDPLASLLGYFFRWVYARAQFDSRRYLSDTRHSLMAMSASGAAFALIALILEGEPFAYALAAAATMTLLTLAGATTHAIIVSNRTRVFMVAVITASSFGLFGLPNPLWILSPLLMFFCLLFAVVPERYTAGD